MSLTKKNISKKISKEIEIDLISSLKLLNSFIHIIKSESVNKNIKISAFGTFYQKKTPKRVGRNPKTMNSYIIKPFRKLQLNASKRIREILN
tara:strand:+ start:1235 stop:1510 length:276 start_codon:yes stop_codon:yes gene_type:complete